jgi:DNA invertase Pin-like site-specific DNA recombinase
VARSVTLTSGRAVGYRRVSTSEQAASGLGLDAQQTAIEATAARLGLSLQHTFTDAGVSGGLALEHRPALLSALDRIEAGDALIVAKRDRLGRDVLHVSMIQRLIERKSARIVSAAGEGTEDDGPTSILMRQIIDAFAEYERAIIRARTRAAMAAAKARGQRAGHIPFGWQLAPDRRTLVISLEEQGVLAELRRLKARGYTLIDIASELNARGLRNRQGRPWRRQFVGQLLERHPAKIA